MILAKFSLVVSRRPVPEIDGDTSIYTYKGYIRRL